MKAYVTTSGEQTTELCCKQLEKFGFEVILLDKNESWESKYKKFINMADGDCLRLDADVIVNKEIKKIREEYDFAVKEKGLNALIVSFNLYDLYRNGIFMGSPIFYTKKAIGIIKRYQIMLHPNRPEASACRLDMINPYKYHSDLIVGLHGFGSDRKAIERAVKNKMDRKQINDFDFDLAIDIIRLYNKDF